MVRAKPRTDILLSTNTAVSQTDSLDSLSRLRQCWGGPAAASTISVPVASAPSPPLPRKRERESALPAAQSSVASTTPANDHKIKWPGKPGHDSV
jgi:hypothetical protein